MSTQQATARFPWRSLAVAGLALAGLVLFGRAAGGRIPEFANWVAGLGVWGPLVFIAGYTVAVVAFVPASLLTAAAGAIFGLTEGILYVFVAAFCGSCLAFLVGRYAARSRIEQRIADHPGFAAIDRATGREGRKIVLLLRLSPVFPFNLLNYALGLTSVRFADYAVASVGMLPGTVLYVYLGKLAGDVAAVAAGVPLEDGPARTALLLVGLGATVAVTVYIARVARRALAETTGAHRDKKPVENPRRSP